MINGMVQNLKIKTIIRRKKQSGAITDKMTRKMDLNEGKGWLLDLT